MPAEKAFERLRIKLRASSKLDGQRQSLPTSTVGGSFVGMARGAGKT